ncbi:MAG: endonuclease/exonuclease/phosphatase family protein [Bdellovibrionales bacterium]|nr:endonuclease/exonuclease/phosphatase family protein [Bdellovibrionales bacterium]
MILNQGVTTAVCMILFLQGLLAQAEPLKIIQFNTWGVPLAVKDTFRYWEAMEAMEGREPDLIVLQEIFSRKGKGAFRSSRYPYEIRGPLGFPRPISSGIRILSKHPVVSSAQVSFCRCTGADCFSKKGAVIAILRLPSGNHLNVVNTHLDAGPSDSVRISQMEQIKGLIETYGDPHAPMIIAGDFNLSDRSEAYGKMMEYFGAGDVWRQTHDSSESGYTYDAYENRYARDYSIKTNSPLIKERIDYVLYRSGKSAFVRPLRSEILFRSEPLYSDHYGIEATFELEPLGSATTPFVAH